MDAFEAATAPEGLGDSTASRAETGNTMRSEQDQSDIYSPEDMQRMLAKQGVLSEAKAQKMTSMELKETPTSPEEV